MSRGCALRLALRVAIVLVAALFPTATWAAEPLPRSVLILDQSDAHSAWYRLSPPAFRSTLNAGSAKRISVYAEHLDLSRFGDRRHDEALRNYLRDKFRATRSACWLPRVVIAGIRDALARGALGRGARGFCRGRRGDGRRLAAS